MKVEAKDPITNKLYTSDISINISSLEKLKNSIPTKEEIKLGIEKLNISADAKSLLFSLVDFSVIVGDFVIKAGVKIIEIVFKFIKRFKNASFGAILGVVLGAIVSLIPVIGPALGVITTKILAAFGFIKGIIKDIKEPERKEVEKTVTETFSSFSFNT